MISIIIPTYNNFDYLKLCIKSLNNNSKHQHELIFHINDGSDGTIEFIKNNGLAKGGSLDNAIVVKDKEILNKDGLRNDKEFVNHKILDCIGDLYTSGYRIIGNVLCYQGGHHLTNQLLRKVFVDKKNFSIIEIREKNLPHTLINRNLLRSIA